MLGCPCLDGTAALSTVAACLHQSGATSWSRSPNFMQEPVKAFCLAGRNGSAYRAKWSNSDAHLAKLEAFQLRNLSDGVFMRDNAVSHQQIEGTHTNEASKGLYMQSKECHLDHHEGVVHGYVGHAYAEHSVDALPGNAPVWNQPSLGMQRVCVGTNREPYLDTGDHVIGANYNAGMIESAHFDEVEAFQGSDVVTAAHHSGGVLNDRESALRTCNCMQHVDMEMELHNARNTAEGFTANNSCVDAQMPGSTNGMHDTLSLANEQGVPNEYGNGGEDASKPSIVGMDVKESTSSSSCKIAAVRVPIYRPLMYSQTSLNDCVFYLESLGVDCNKLFQDEPSIKSCTVKQIKAWVSALEHYGIPWNDTGRIFNISPKVLLLDPEKDLKTVTGFLLNEAGLSPQDLRKVIRRCPRVLVADLKTQLRPTLSFLRTLGYSRMGHVIANNPNLLSYGVESRLLPRLRLLESWGLTYREAAAVAVRFPAIFNYSALENLQCKFDYLIHDIGAGKKDLLAFPQYFGYSLESRIRPRHQCIAKLNVSLSVQAMLTLSEAEFHAKFVNMESRSANGDEACSMGKRETGASLYESIEAKLHECNKELPMSASFENPETRVLVSV